MDILHVKASQIEGVSGLTLTLRSLLTDHRCLHATRCATVSTDTVVGQLTGECLVELILQRLHLVVLETIAGTDVTALFYIQFIRGLIPNITHIVDAEVILNALFRN